jgi:hypothetical protein
MLTGAVWLTYLPIVSSAAADSTALSLPADIPAAERSRLTGVAAGAAVATRVDGEPFLARRDIFLPLIPGMTTSSSFSMPKFLRRSMRSFRFLSLHVSAPPSVV